MSKKIVSENFLLALILCFVFLFQTDNGSVFLVKTKANADPQIPELVLQTGHSATVSAVVFGKKKNWLATAGFDNTVKIWDTKIGRELRTLNGHTGAVKTLAVSPDDRWIASAGNDRVIRIWDAVSGDVVKQIPAHESAIESLTFDAAGKRLASGGADSKINIWDISAWQKIATFEGHQGWVTALKFSPDGKILASGGMDHLVKVWDTEKNKELRTFNKHTGKIQVLAFTGDGQQLASAGEDAVIRIWNLNKDKESAVFDKQPGTVLALQFTPQDTLRAATADGSVKVWDVQQKREIKAEISTNQIPSDESPQAITSAAFSSDEKTVALGGGDTSIGLFNLVNQNERQFLNTQTSRIKTVAISGKGNYLATGGSDHLLRIWDLQTGMEIPPLVGHNGFITGVAIAPDEQHVYSSSIDGSIRVWNLNNRNIKTVLLKGHKGSVQAIAINKKGDLLASAGVDKTVKLWDLQTNREIHNFTEHSKEVTAVAFSNQNTIAAGGVDKKVLLWDAVTKKLLQTFLSESAIVSINFSPDGKMIAAGCADKTVHIWETNSGKALKTLNNSLGAVNALVFSPDSKTLYYGGQDQTLRRLNLSSNQEQIVLKAHDDVINSMALNSAGNWLFSASENGSLILWETKKLTKAATLISLRDEDEWLTVTPQGIFDGSEKAWNQILWRFGKDTFNVKPVEVFWSEFFRPGLLADLLQGRISLDQTNSISEKDRRQPELKIALADGVENKSVLPSLSNRRIKVKLEVSEAPAGEGFQIGSGVRDIRLFRNGSLVKLWDGDVIKQGDGKIILETDVNLVAGSNQLTAYAFNHDNIKSSDVAIKLNGAESLRRRGNAYVIAIGVGRYENPEYNLSFVESDISAVESELKSKLSRLNIYEKTEVLPLFNEMATKQNILLAISKLSGKDLSQVSGAGKLPVEIERIKKTEPEDTIIIYFSGHGTARDGHFYMLPHDIGYRGARSELTKEKYLEILSRSISDLELEKVFRDIDAKNILLIIDACHSGQAVETADERRGPTNAKGLAQLAHDKGISILTASQSSESAYVSKSLKFSYLTFALIEEGLKNFQADNSPKDSRVSLEEWFDYAAVRVPELREETIRKNAVTEQNKDLIEEEEKQIKATQRPRVFYRRQNNFEPFVVAQINSQKN